VGAERGLRVVGEHAGLQAVPGGVHRGEGLVVGVDGGEDDDRPEHLLGAHLGVLWHVVEHGGRVARPVAGAAGEHAAAGRHGLVDPRLHPPGGGLVDERADVGRVVVRVADTECGDVPPDLLDELVVDVAVGVDALHGDAGLARRWPHSRRRCAGSRRKLLARDTAGVRPRARPQHRPYYPG
jgi:hypothetical protein